MLTHITSIRSTSEILKEVADIDPPQRQRFHNTLEYESAELTGVTQRLISFFETQIVSNPTAAAAEQVDEFIIAHRNHFAELEEAAAELRRNIGVSGVSQLYPALERFLDQKLGIRIAVDVPLEQSAGRFRNQCWFDGEQSTLHFLANSPHTTRRFQLARVAAEQCHGDLLSKLTSDRRLNSHTARHQARHILSAYIASATLFPYERFLEDAERSRYDIEMLRQRYGAGLEQICHRLVSLRRPGAEGVPFAFLRVDQSGHISKRFPLERLPLPRYGHVCPLWPVFSAFQAPGRISRHLGEFPDGNRFLMIARTNTKQLASFHAQPVMFSIMIACDAIHADRVIYSEGLDMNAEGTALRVGPSCSQCSRENCQQRQEAAWTLNR